VPTGHWDCVNDGVRSPATNGDGYLLYVAGTTQNLREEFTLTASPSGVGTVTAIKVWGRGYRTQGSGSNVDIQADVYVAGGWLGAKALGMGGSAAYGSASWSGSWTKAQADAAIVAYVAGGSPFYDSYYELDWGCVELTYSSGATTFSPNSLAQSQSLGAATISQVHVLSPAALAESQSLGAGAINQAHALNPAALAEPQSLGAGAISQAHVLSPAALAESQSLGAATVSQVHALSPDGVAQGQRADADVSLFYLLTPDGVWQAQSLEAALLLANHVLRPDDVAQGQALEAAAVPQVAVGQVSARIAAPGRGLAVGPLLLSAGIAGPGTSALVPRSLREAPVPLPSLTVRIHHA
jgi:hypothetical protein